VSEQTQIPDLPEEFHYGKIVCLQGSWGSGLATLIVLNRDGVMVSIPCDNAPTVRALDGAFGDFIAPGHTFNNEAIAGKEIIYSYDETGIILGGITPIENLDELMERYEEWKEAQG